MRKRKPPPTCDCCGVATQEYESEQWPGFGLCFQCWRVLANWFVTHNLADENPLAEELLIGVWSQEVQAGSHYQEGQYFPASVETHYWIVHDSKHDSSASAFRLIKRVRNQE